MINNIFHSLASKLKSEAIDVILTELEAFPYLDEKEKTVISYCKSVSEHGRYPDKDYFLSMGYEIYRVTNSFSELKHEVEVTKDHWWFEVLRRKVYTKTNEANTYKELLSSIKEVVLEDANVKASSLQEYSMKLRRGALLEKGYLLSVDEIDSVTSGFQYGTVASLAAFTSHGKSTLAVSSTYKNLKKGWSGIIVSLEVTTSVVLDQVFSRWLFEEKNLEVAPLAMTDGSLDEKMQSLVEGYQDEFDEWIEGKLLVVDEAILSKTLVSDFRELSNIYKEAETMINSVDFVIFDHINQVDLLFKDMGNVFVKTLTSAGKTFINSKGRQPVSIMCVQTNREGLKRAQKRAGKYDLLAISDLNEVERSSHYVVFMYTSDDMKVMQETALMLAKHRLGGLVTEPISTAFNPVSFVVGETVETVSFAGDLSFMKNMGEITGSEFDEFE